MQNFAGLKVKEYVNGLVPRQMPLSTVWSFSQTVNHRCVYKIRIYASATTGRAHVLRHPMTISQHLPVSGPWSGTTRQDGPVDTQLLLCVCGRGREGIAAGAGNQSCRPPRLSFPLGRSREPDVQLSVCRAGACLEGAGILSLWQGGCPAGSSVGSPSPSVPPQHATLALHLLFL